MPEEDRPVSEENNELSAKLFGSGHEEIFSFAGYNPRISIQNEIVASAYDTVSRRQTITANGFIILPAPEIKNGTTTSTTEPPVQTLMKAQDALVSALSAHRRFRLEITDNNDKIVETFHDTKLNNIDFEEGVWNEYCKFTVTFTSDYNKHSSIVEFTETFDVSREEGFGYINATDGVLETNGHLTGSHKISATGGNVNAMSSELQSFTLEDGDKFVTAFETYLCYRTETSNTSVDVTGRNVSITQTYVLIPDDSNYVHALASYSESKTYSADTGVGKLSISGEFRSLGYSSDIDTFNYFKSSFGDTLFSHAQNSPLLGTSEFIRDSYGSSFDNSKWDNIGSAVGKSATLDSNSNTISFSADYEIVEYDHDISNARSQEVNITLTPQRSVAAVIPVIGKANGPALQNTGSSTEAQKSLSLEVTFSPGHTSSSEYSSILDLFSRHEPQAMTNHYNQKQLFGSFESESWDATSNRYSATVNWIYLPSRLQTFAPNDTSTAYGGKIPYLPTKDSLETGGGWHKDLDYAIGGDTLLPRSREFKNSVAVHNPVAHPRLLDHEGYIDEFSGRTHLLNIFVHKDDLEELNGVLELFGEDKDQFSIEEAPTNTYDKEWAKDGEWKALFFTPDEDLFPLKRMVKVDPEDEDSEEIEIGYKSKYIAQIRKRNGPGSTFLTSEINDGKIKNVYETIKYNLYIKKAQRQPTVMTVSPASITCRPNIYRQDFLIAEIDLTNDSLNVQKESFHDSIEDGYSTFWLSENPKGIYKILRTDRHKAKLYIRSGSNLLEWQEYNSDKDKYEPIKHKVNIHAKDLASSYQLKDPLNNDDDGYPKDKILTINFEIEMEAPLSENVHAAFIPPPHPEADENDPNIPDSPLDADGNPIEGVSEDDYTKLPFAHLTPFGQIDGGIVEGSEETDQGYNG